MLSLSPNKHLAYCVGQTEPKMLRLVLILCQVHAEDEARSKVGDEMLEVGSYSLECSASQLI